MVQPLHKKNVAQLKPHHPHSNFGEIIWIGGSSKLVGGHLKAKPSGWLMKETVGDLTITNPVVGSLAG